MLDMSIHICYDILHNKWVYRGKKEERSKIMLSKVKITPAFIVFAPLLLFSFILYSNRPENLRDQDEISSITSDFPVASSSSFGLHRFKDFNFTEYVKYKNKIGKKFTISGKSMGLRGDALGPFQVGPVKRLYIRGAKTEFYEQDQIVSTVISKRAYTVPLVTKTIGSAIAKKLEFENDITVTTGDFRMLTCDNLTWDNIENKFFAHGNCILRYDGEALRTDVMVLSADLKEFSHRKYKNRLERYREIF